MKLSFWGKQTIRSRLRLATYFSLVAFLLVVLALLVSFSQINSYINRVVEEQLQRTVENSQVSRDLGQFLSRLQLLGNSFYDDPGILESEAQQLTQMLEELPRGIKDPSLQQLLVRLQKELKLYLEQGQVVNSLIQRRDWLDSDINQTLLLLEEIVAEQIVEQVLKGGDAGSLEQLTLLISGFRESLLEIAKKNAEENHHALLQKKLTDQPPLTDELANLGLRLRTLTASEPPLDRFGRHLTDQIAYYQFLMHRYLQEMVHLGEETRNLNLLTEQILANLGQVDLQSSQAAQVVRREVQQTMLATGIAVLILLSLIGLLIWWTHFMLLRKHIQEPMDKARTRLQRFQRGDYSSPMNLGRHDEWGEIEAAFNGMVTALVEGMAALHESERRYRDIFDNASEGIYQSSIEGTFLTVNPAMAEILGYANPQQAITSFNDLRHQLYENPEDRDRHLNNLYRQGTVFGSEYRMRRASGEVFWASINAHLVLDEQEKPAFIEGTIQDITKSRSSQEALQQLQNYLQNIIDSMPSILIAIDIQSDITLWNQRAAEMTGLAPDQAKGMLLTEALSLIDGYHYLPLVNETLRSWQPNRLAKIPIADTEQQRYFDILIFPLSLTGASGAVLHIEEVTERVQIEELMVHSEKMLSVGGLAAGMAHEINNPLAAILQNTQVLSQRLSPMLAKNHKVAEEIGINLDQLESYARERGILQILQSITEAGQRAARIVDNMLSFSRKSTSNFLPRSLQDLLEQTLELAASDFDLKHNFDFRRIEILRDYRPVPDVPCEAGQIQQVLLNLLKNAAHALKGQPEPRLELRLYAQGNEVYLQLEDNGPGMEDAIRRRVFEPFFTTKAVGSGTGLGLSVSYFIISENHGGSLTVSSEPGQGSCFTIQLPLPSSAA